MTILEHYDLIIKKIADGSEFTDDDIAFLKNRKEQISKKNENRKPTKTQRENAEIAEVLFSFMAETPDKEFTVGELLKTAPCFNTETTQSKANAIVTKLKKDGKVFRREEKGVAYFKVMVKK